MEATEPYTDDVTFAELRRLNLVGQRGPEPRQLLMTVANELANNVQRGTSLTDQSIREISASYDRRLEASGGDRARIKQYAEAIVLYRRSIESLAGLGEELQTRVHEVPRDLVGFAAAPTAGSTVETAAAAAGISVEDALNKLVLDEKPSTAVHSTESPALGTIETSSSTDGQIMSPQAEMPLPETAGVTAGSYSAPLPDYLSSQSFEDARQEPWGASKEVVSGGPAWLQLGLCTANEFRSQGNLYFRQGDLAAAKGAYEHALTLGESAELYRNLALTQLTISEKRPKSCGSTRKHSGACYAAVNYATRAVFLQPDSAKAHYLLAWASIEDAVLEGDAKRWHKHMDTVWRSLRTAQMSAPDDAKVAALTERATCMQPPSQVFEVTGTPPPVAFDGCCSICLDEPVAPVLLPCGHSNCKDCTERLRSLGVNDRCPMCRAPLPPSAEDTCVSVAGMQTRFERLQAQEQTETAAAVLADAIAKLRVAVNMDPAHALSHHLLGKALLDQFTLDAELLTRNLGTREKRDCADSLAASRRAIELVPPYAPYVAPTYCNIGAVLSLLGQTDAAIAALQSGLEQSAGDDHLTTGILVNLSSTACQAKDFEAAINYARRAVVREPRRKGVRAALASAYYAKGLHENERGDFEGALSAFLSSLRAFPRRSTYFIAADLQAKMGDAAGAIKSMRACVELDPKDFEALAILAEFLEQFGDTDDAISAYMRSLSLDPDPLPVSHARLAKLLRKRGDYDAAILSYNTSITMDPNYSASHHGLGLAFWQKGDRSNALRCLKHAIALEPHDLGAKQNLMTLTQQISEDNHAFQNSTDWRVYINGLRSRPEINGTVGVVRSFNVETARYAVKLETTGELVALKSANLSSVDGERWAA